MSERSVPSALLERVRGDLRPVRPLASPVRRAAALAPLGLLLLVGVPLVGGWRDNLSALDPGWAWGLSGLQALAGLWVVGVALREAVPGRELSARALGVTLGTAGLLFVGITLATARILPTRPPAEVWLRFVWECLEVEVVAAIPVLAAAAWLVARALPNRPALAGGIYGIGAGLLADAGTRLFCWVSAPSHVLVSHGGGIVLLGVAGAVVASVLEGVKRPPPG